ncbi:acyl-dehydrogenase nm domain-like protein [Neofusicoccum parvum]|nr:acyl-dehydrogenase nm domain-like protein [Neofusicoccum parvum]
MEEGVTSFALPKRAGAQANDHAVTMFHHKRLPKEALLGSLEKPADPHTHFSEIIGRASVGTLSLSTVNVPCLKLSAYIAGKYSLRREVTAPDGKQIPIVQYRTQQRPILHALAQAAVWEAAAKHAADLFVTSKDATVKSTTAIAFKVAIQGQTQDTLTQLADRCGAQGLYEHNTIIRAQNLMRGNSLAEGELVVISIRLTTELLLNHAALPTSPHPDAPLPRYAAGLLAEARATLATLPAGGTHDVHDAAFNAAILPLCQPLAEAIGYQLAFDGARGGGVPADLLAAFEAGVVLRGASWFVEHAGRTRRELLAREEAALTAVAARFGGLLDGLGVEAFARAPLLTEGAWGAFVEGLPRCVMSMQSGG